jgi:prepilin-type N-terminal cleavage/methylation domain-containing protein
VRSRHHPAATPRGYSLVEVLIVVTIALIALGMVLPPMKRGFDRLATRAAANDVVSAFFVARAAAVAAARRTTVTFDSTGRISVLTHRGDTMLTRAVASLHRVTLTTNRREMIYTPVGLGYAGANLTIVLRRGRAVDTVVVSREGRVRRGRR